MYIVSLVVGTEPSGENRCLVGGRRNRASKMPLWRDQDHSEPRDCGATAAVSGTFSKYVSPDGAGW